MCLVFGLVCDYNSGLSGNLTAAQQKDDGGIDKFYPFFQDVHVMIFVGFGFLVTFQKNYSMSGVAINFLLAALAFQWSTLTNGFWHQVDDGDSNWHTIHLNIETLITSDFGAGAVLITFGALLGKVTPLQLFWIMISELIVYSFNEWVGAVKLEAVDMGGSMFVHSFGAYFGLACSLAMCRRHKAKWRDTTHQTSTTTSDMFAMIGTLFLWMFWPSFNGALAEGASQHRVVVNTVLALTGSCISAFAASTFLRPHQKFSMVDIQNATLAGGVAVGSASDLVISPYGGLVIGAVAGCVSVAGYVYLTPWLEHKMNLHDTAGVHNLHGMPGIIGGLGGAISAAVTSDTEYGQNIGDIYSARDPNGDNRSASDQALFQLATLVITLVSSLVGGYLTGLVVVNFVPPPATMYHDGEYFELEEGEKDEKDAKASLAYDMSDLSSSGPKFRRTVDAV